MTRPPSRSRSDCEASNEMLELSAMNMIAGARKIIPTAAATSVRVLDKRVDFLYFMSSSVLNQ